jgi:uncharacterized OsmC-like protein
MNDDYAVSVAAGSLRASVRPDADFPHRWTEQGVAVQTEFTGAHLLHLAAAACVLNDLYREAAKVGLQLRGVRVDASGNFDPANWTSTGIAYHVEIDSAATPAELDALLRTVDEVAEIPRALRAGAPVDRAEEPAPRSSRLS